MLLDVTLHACVWKLSPTSEQTRHEAHAPLLRNTYDVELHSPDVKTQPVRFEFDIYAGHTHSAHTVAPVERLYVPTPHVRHSCDASAGA